MTLIVPNAPEHREKQLHEQAIMAKIAPTGFALIMKSMSARDAKNAFGLLLDTARAEPVSIEKHGRPVVVVLSVERYKRLVKSTEFSAARKKEKR
jgi:prevent-host-death family protein